MSLPTFVTKHIRPLKEVTTLPDPRKMPAGERPPKRPPAATPEARENQLINLSYDLAERQILEGTASAQVVTHFLKLGSTRERLEQRKIEKDIKLAEAKIESMASSARVEELYKEAMEALSTYKGETPPQDPHDT